MEVIKCFINLYFQNTLQTCNLNTFILENDFEYSPFLLIKLEHDSTIFPSLLLAYTFYVLDLIRQHNQSNTIRYLLCTSYYALCTMHYALFTIHYALCTMHYILCTMYYTLCIIYYALCIMHYLLCTMHYALCIYIYTYLYIFTILYDSYVFIISRGNPAKSRDFGTHA